MNNAELQKYYDQIEKANRQLNRFRSVKGGYYITKNSSKTGEELENHKAMKHNKNKRNLRMGKYRSGI